MKELGRNGILCLIIFVVIGTSRILKRSIRILKEGTNTKIELCILNLLPLAFASCAWLIIFLGFEYYIIDIFACAYQLLSAFCYTVYLFKRISIDIPYSYGKFQHHMILLDSIYFFGVKTSVSSCEKVNNFTRLQILVFLCYSASTLAKIAGFLYIYSINGKLGSWELNSWGFIRGLEIIALVVFSLSTYYLYRALLMLSETDWYFFYSFTQILLHSIIPVAASLILYPENLNSNIDIIYFTSLFNLMVSIVSAFYLP